jgi:hypothetical protein
MSRRLPSLLLACLLTSALLFSTQAIAQKSSAYRGKTSQGKQIQIASSQSQIAPIRFKVKMLCRDGSLLFGDASDFEATVLSASGRFSDTQYGMTDTVAWSGRLKGRTISGTLRVKDRLQSGVRCDSGPVSFSAKQTGR